MPRKRNTGISRCRCGGEAVVRVGLVCLDRVAYVECRKCLRRTKLYFIEHPILRMVNGVMMEDKATLYSEEEAKAKAIDAWNRRLLHE